jgi:uncharacterized protein YqgC (DUF456 family)
MKVGMVVIMMIKVLLVGIVGAVVPAAAAVRAPTVAAAAIAMTAVMVVVMAMMVVVVVVVVGAGVIVAGVGATVLVHCSVSRRRSRGSSRIALLSELLGAVLQHARLLGRSFGADLLGPHAGVAAAELQQLLVRARLDDLAVVQAKDLVGVRDGG